MNKRQRIILLTTPRTYRARPFLDAAQRLDVEVVQAVDLPRELADAWQYPLGVDFSKPDEAAETIIRYARQYPAQAVLPLDDSGALLAAQVSQALGLPYNSVTAAEAARDKYQMRQILSQSGLLSPAFTLFQSDAALEEVTRAAPFPAVIKPLRLSGSRGVIRVNNREELAAAVPRIAKIVYETSGAEGPYPLLAEQFIPGCEVALEGLLHEGRLNVLALFDKPDPLDGPFFEETIYTTPSRLPEKDQAAIARCAAEAALAIGLQQGPVHAELRLNQQGPWIIEIAGRSIGGLCSQTLRFGENVSLEELILRQALGRPIDSFARERPARGVMMIPIPEAGLLRRVSGLEAAQEVAGIEEITITAKLNYRLRPLPEGDNYLGFIFARGQTPAEVEAALRRAHRRLSFQIEPIIPLAT